MKTRVDPQLIELLGVSLESITETKKKYFQGLESSTDFRYQDYASFLAETFGRNGARFSSAEIVVIFENPLMYKEMLYPDVLPTLLELKQKGHTLGVYSEGHDDLQKNKLTYTGIIDFFDPAQVHISRRKKTAEIISKLKIPSILIDDKLEYLQGLPDGITPLLIQRDVADADKPVQILRSLEEVTRFIK